MRTRTAAQFVTLIIRSTARRARPAIAGSTVTAYGIYGSPAIAVRHGVFELASRKVDLCISGINYGENIGATITSSGFAVAQKIEQTSGGSRMRPRSARRSRSSPSV